MKKGKAAKTDKVARLVEMFKQLPPESRERVIQIVCGEKRHA